MGEFINPMDFRTIFVDYFLGSIELFTFAFVILFSFICAKFQMGNTVFLTLLAVCGLIMAGVLGQPIYVLIILIVGFVSFKSLSRIIT